MQSDAWKNVREKALNTYGRACMACDSTDRLTVHHVHYPRPLTNTGVGHVMILCWGCHQHLHQLERMLATVRKAENCDLKRTMIIKWLRSLKGRISRQPWRRVELEMRWSRRLSAIKNSVSHHPFAVIHTPTS
jgi:hypothetical protein